MHGLCHKHDYDFISCIYAVSNWRETLGLLLSSFASIRFGIVKKNKNKYWQKTSHIFHLDICGGCLISLSTVSRFFLACIVLPSSSADRECSCLPYGLHQQLIMLVLIHTYFTISTPLSLTLCLGSFLHPTHSVSLSFSPWQHIGS